MDVTTLWYYRKEDGGCQEARAVGVAPGDLSVCACAGGDLCNGGGQESEPRRYRGVRCYLGSHASGERPSDVSVGPCDGLGRVLQTKEGVCEADCTRDDFCHTLKNGEEEEEEERRGEEKR